MTEDALPPLPTSALKAPLPAAKTPTEKKQPSHHPLIWLELGDRQARGETALWVAVITQAMQDALSRCKKPESQFHKHEATCWLTGNSKDFVEVCLRADMDPDYVRRKAKQALASPNPWRAAAGKGKRYLERKAYRQKQREEAKKEALKATHTPTVINGPWQ